MIIDLSPAERQVLDCIAGGNARDLAALAACTGFTVKHAGRILTQLSKRGLECRVQVGTDAAGRPKFSAKGRPVTFQLPESYTESCCPNGAPMLPNAAPLLPIAAPPEPPEMSESVGFAPPDLDPYKNQSQNLEPKIKTPEVQDQNNHSFPTVTTGVGTEPPSRYVAPPEVEAIEKLAEPLRTIARSMPDLSPTIGELEELHHWVRVTKQPANALAYIRGMAAKDAFRAPLLARRQQGAAAAADAAKERIRQARLTGPWCPHGEADVTMANGQPWCVGCRQARPRALQCETESAFHDQISDWMERLNRTGEMTEEQIKLYAQSLHQIFAAGVTI